MEQRAQRGVHAEHPSALQDLVGQRQRGRSVAEHERDFGDPGLRVQAVELAARGLRLLE